MSIQNYSVLNSVIDFTNKNVYLLQNPEIIINNASNEFGNVVIGYSSNFISFAEVKDCVLMGKNAIAVNTTGNPSLTIRNGIALGAYAAVTKSYDCILGYRNRVAIGTQIPNFALHISNIFDIDSVLLNSAAIYIDEAQDTTQFNNMPNTGGVFYVREGQPYFKSLTNKTLLGIKSSGIVFLNSVFGSQEAFAYVDVIDSQVKSDSKIIVQRIGNIENNPRFVANIGTLIVNNVTDGFFRIQSTTSADVGQILYIVF